MQHDIVTRLLSSPEPSIRFKAKVYLQGCSPDSEELRNLQQEIKQSPRIQSLLAPRANEGRFPRHPYKKWDGAHWVLTVLADLGYPPGDSDLAPIFRQVYDWLLSSGHLRSVRILEGRARCCASQEGNALLASIKLGYLGAEAHELAGRLIGWQWQDGGWNCDKRPEAHHSSFHESLIPMHALGSYARATGDSDASEAASRAAEFFLRHELYKSERDGKPIDPHFTALHYPYYWHYDILYALKVMVELGLIFDLRCRAALDLLESKQLPGGGFRAEEKFYNLTRPEVSQYSPVAWGPVSKKTPNDFVTVDALYVLKQAGRLTVK